MAMKKKSCPKCGELGKPVQEITLNSLLKNAEIGRMCPGPYFFCQTSSCPVVYFDETGNSVFEKNALALRVGVKESEAPRPVCYCFDHTIEEIEEQVASTGGSTVPDDIATRMKEACWCETKSPLGSCCMSTVSKYVKAAKANAGQMASTATKEEFKDCCSDYDQSAAKVDDCRSVLSKSARDSGRKLGVVAIFGAVFTAVLSSICCWLPLLSIAFGASAAGVSGFLEAYHFWFLGGTGLLLLMGFYLVYFREKSCAPGSACATPDSKLQRFNKSMLWFASIFVALFSFLPNYLGNFLSDANTGVEIPDNLDQPSLSIEGMTCEGCANGVTDALKNLKSVSTVNIDFSKK